MHNRREFLKLSALLGLAASGLPQWAKASAKVSKPVVVSTWEHGQPANAAAWQVLSAQGSALDAVEAGVRVPEADPLVRTVGLGGYPDASGKVTLDACIMDHQMNCGAVACLQDIKHPISVARKVMEQTPHVLLVGEGAKAFALEQGFTEENLLTSQAKADWLAWREGQKATPQINIENHDTIGMLALDTMGNLSGACTTSGAAYKLPGRVGDSPIIGAGLYVDNQVGAATATGMGELMIKTVGCHLVVELMAQGLTPQQACQKAVERIAARLGDYQAYQVGFLALNKQGQSGAFCIHPGFNYALQDNSGSKLLDSASLLGAKV
ncbi:N(4)-(beta-N-acetylglucosaminyl)-L-asparaginase [Aliiglaciecola sp. CAU 1673]|uniref:N(4)-(beta-N-acetylglucosaminyl)-L-asparaginase n=1 Tax=Aliiglaciecola sp. CAU 1673 TaxID=3032595 RepID=UPI0023DA891C|nr:N(4)-(beta-N-acetylglucosaminyl)-L-asparaginase [Aliiglaciecola sp. CAU 1673]MDF2178604.1 N(4)-(beta-N-acetylglucosaminyl)-L-asparaginase [Aliiglaciecola sp. CAU 1673]